LRFTATLRAVYLANFFRSASLLKILRRLPAIYTMNGRVIAYLLSRIISLFQAASLRERYYIKEQRVEILETAIEDIERIAASDSESRLELIQNICSRVKSI